MQNSQEKQDLFTKSKARTKSAAEPGINNLNCGNKSGTLGTKSNVKV